MADSVSCGNITIFVFYCFMKILQLCNRIPFPLNDGGNLAVMACTQGFLEANIELSMLAMNTTRHWVNINDLPPVFNELQHFKTIEINNNISTWGALKSILKKTSYNIDRFISSEYDDALIQLLKENAFDIIQLEGLFLVPYIATIKKYSKAKVVLRQHNIEFRIWERLAAKAQNPIKKWYLHLLAARLKSFELKHLSDYDLVLPISPKDDSFFKTLGATSPTYYHPFGIDISNIPFSPATKTPITLYHIGAMDWLPNQESVNWLVEKVMPLVIRQHPDIQLHLAGRKMPEHYFGLEGKNIIVHGEVPDAQAFERNKSILVVPLLSGGGVRIKIFQAMAMGKTVVTTSIGVEGNEARDGIEVFIADSPEAFAEKINEIVTQPELIERSSKAARQLIEQKYSNQKITADLLHQYNKLLARNAPN